MFVLMPVLVNTFSKYLNQAKIDNSKKKSPGAWLQSRPYNTVNRYIIETSVDF